LRVQSNAFLINPKEFGVWQFVADIACYATQVTARGDLGLIRPEKKNESVSRNWLQGHRQYIDQGARLLPRHGNNLTLPLQ
ncbi:MAG: hypothetical protein P8Y14_27045, partial [Anaerolineales bacterium]